MDGVRVTLGPPPVEGFDPKTMIGTTVTIERGGPGAGRVVDAWIHEGMIVALLTVEGPMKGLLEEKAIAPDVLHPAAVERRLDAHAPMPMCKSVLVPFEEIERWRNAPSNTASADTGTFNRDALSYTIDKYGGIYSMKRVTLGGFRTRYRVRWARVILRMLRPSALADGIRGLLEMETAAQDMEDYMRTCPHRPEWIHRNEESRSAWCMVCLKGMPYAD